jgi:predicted AlkP superfamily phosphohydrolase/phosphomutase
MLMSKIVVLGVPGFGSNLAGIEDLPNLKKMQEDGIWGKVQGSLPSNSPTAWTCALSSRNPGAFGFWGISSRDTLSYDESKSIDVKTKDQRVKSLYTILPNLGQKVAILGVPITSPPPRIPGGYCISDSLEQDRAKGFTWPKTLVDEIRGLVGEYLLDTGPLSMEKDHALKTIYEMDSQRFSLLKYFMGKKQCDCVVAVITGMDKMARHFARYWDENHRKHEPDPRYKSAFRDYSLWLDKQIGEVRDALDESTVFLILSDHSTQRLEGKINLNEWLIQEGYMYLREYPSEPTAIEMLNVEWSKTKAWAMGTSGQVYINLKGRESDGTVDPSEYEKLLDELIGKLKEVPDEKGNLLKTRLFKRHEIYSGPFADYAPDLFVFFDEGRWKTTDLVGFGSRNLYSLDPSQTKEDGAEGMDGYFCLAGPGIPRKGEYVGASLLDMAPTVLDVMDLEIPSEMEGVSLSGKERTPEEEEALIQERLKFLGY